MSYHSNNEITCKRERKRKKKDVLFLFFVWLFVVVVEAFICQLTVKLPSSVG